MEAVTATGTKKGGWSGLRSISCSTEMEKRLCCIRIFTFLDWSSKYVAGTSTSFRAEKPDRFHRLPASQEAFGRRPGSQVLAKVPQGSELESRQASPQHASFAGMKPVPTPSSHFPKVVACLRLLFILRKRSKKPCINLKNMIK